MHSIAPAFLALADRIDRARSLNCGSGAFVHFRFIQLPFNLQMVEALVNRTESVLDVADALGVAVVASGTLLQGRVFANISESLTGVMPGLTVGMGRPGHMLENLGAARSRPILPEEYMRLFP